MPSASVLESKKKIVSDLTERMKNAVAGVIVSYQGITVENDTALRAELRKAGVEYSVIKNTLTKRACEAVGFDALTGTLEGMTAVATCDSDPVAAAKILKKYADKVETFEIKAGFVDGKVIDVNEVKVYASIPNKETLISKMMGSLQAPIGNLVRTLDAIAKKDESAAE